MIRKIRDFEKKIKKNLASGSLARVHIVEDSKMVIKKAFIIGPAEPDGLQLQLFPLILVYIIHSNVVKCIFESQVLEILSAPQ